MIPIFVISCALINSERMSFNLVINLVRSKPASSIQSKPSVKVSTSVFDVQKFFKT